MAAAEDPLDQPATLDTLQALRRGGSLPVEAHRAASWWVAQPPPPATWRRTLEPLALLLGVALVVAGVLYLVAFNWAELGRFSKVVVGVVPVLLAGGIAAVLGTHGLAGKALTAAGIPLTLGALLAVGLAYPTNAEGWPLIALWAALSIPWAIASRLGASWIGVVIAVDLAIAAYLATYPPSDGLGLDLTLLAFCGVHAIMWAGFSTAGALKLPGADAWVRQVLLAPALGLLAFWPMELLTVHSWDAFGADYPMNAVDILGTLAFVGVGVAVHVGFALGRWGPFPPAIQLLTAMVVATTAIIRVVAELDPTGEFFMIFLTVPLGALVLLQLALSGAWLVWGWRRQGRAPAATSGGAP